MSDSPLATEVAYLSAGEGQAFDGTVATITDLDPAGRVSHVEEPFGLGLTFAYDAAGQPTSREVAEAGIAPARADYGYTARGETGSVTRYADLGGTAEVGATDYPYDPAGRLTNIETINGPGGVLGNYTYVYDAAELCPF